MKQVALGLVLLVACEDDAHPRPRDARPPPSAPSVLSASGRAGGETSPSTANTTTTTTSTGCDAPSLAFDGPMDAFTSDALKKCVSLRTGEAKASLRCGETRTPDDAAIAAMIGAALPLDAATRARIVAVGKKGKEAGLDPTVAGLVGDSMTVSLDFLEALSPKSRRVKRSAPPVAAALQLASGGSVVDYLTRTVDSFRIPRAARVGARVPYATESGAASPLARLLDTYRPAIVVVAFGANDAAHRPSPPETLADDFERDLLALITTVESRGAILVLSNEMRHLDQPGVKACPSDDPLANDWRVAVATNAIVRRTAEIACREHLPFVDLRAALEGATHHGLSPDGVHPSVHREGGGVLDAAGLDCGYNIRNLVTLVALRRVLDVLIEEGIAPR